MKQIPRLLLFLLVLCLCGSAAASSDSCAVVWSVRADGGVAWVPDTKPYFKELNINTNTSAAIKTDFRFPAGSPYGQLYPGVYQGLGVELNTYGSGKSLGTPVSAFVYQGAPIFSFGRLWLSYEWQFGAAMGWHHSDEFTEYNMPVSTAVTAHMALGFKINYAISSRWQMNVGVEGKHFSNGNTSWPNGGVNTLGAKMGIAYVIEQGENSRSSRERFTYTTRRDNVHNRVTNIAFDIVAYGAARKRIVRVGDPAEPVLCRSSFPVAGLQLSPLKSVNQYFLFGPSLELQWDESANLERHWAHGTTSEDIKFYRPPFGSQLSLGLSAHAELSMPIFAVNVGMGYDVLNPRGNKAFYQMLTLKTFMGRRFFINVGYRLANFSEPQNLMLGLGVRI